MEEKFCSRISEQLGERLYGTAGQADTFFLLEYNGAWEDKAFEKSALPDVVKNRLNNLASSLKAAKILLIKRSPLSQPAQGEAKTSLPIHFYVSLASDNAARLYRFELERYEELLELDLPGVLSGESDYERYLQPESLFLVCTNGRRDLCCARFGIPVYQELRQAVGAAAWECSHVGGHRFATNIYILPQAFLYGRVESVDIPGLLAAEQAGQLLLEKLRGRTIYAPIVQAAEYFLRNQQGEMRLGAYSLVEARQLAEDRWQVQLGEVGGDRQHILEVGLEKSEQQVFESCALDKSTPIVRYRLIRQRSI